MNRRPAEFAFPSLTLDAAGPGSGTLTPFIPTTPIEP